MLKSDSNYAPNEDDLKIATLQTLDDNMKALNDNIGNILAPVKNAQNKRNDLMYKEETGMVDVAKLVKDYVQGVYGSVAPEAKAIKKLKFTKPNKK